MWRFVVIPFLKELLPEVEEGGKVLFIEGSRVFSDMVALVLRDSEIEKFLLYIMGLDIGR